MINLWTKKSIMSRWRLFWHSMTTKLNRKMKGYNNGAMTTKKEKNSS